MATKTNSKISVLPLLVIMGFSGSLVGQPNICGFVTDRSDSSAVEGATIYLYDEYNLPLFNELRTTTDDTGYFEFTNIEPLKYSINTWTYFTFQEDTFAFVLQPGIFDVDTSKSMFEHPCFYVNFEFNLEVTDSSFNELKESFINSYLSYFKDFDFGEKDWPTDLLPLLIQWEITTIDSLFTRYPDMFVRRKDW
ncbi:MAG: carboxypeptidase regulatory-like domain-containing protein [Balneola sp.]|nr:MAG: carboxypeptidase regulatory-like domain-containing protein [Balneola sp.]